MEGVVLESGALTFAAAFGALVVLALAAAGILLGSIADRERTGEEVHWSAEPIPESGPETPETEEIRHAA